MGYSSKYLSKNPFVWQDSIHPDDVDLVKRTIEGFGEGKSFSIEYRIKDASGNWHWFLDRSIGMQMVNNEPVIEGLATDITQIKQLVEERDQAIKKLEDSLQQVKRLSGLLPICANCKKIRDDKGYWRQVETYITEHTDAEFSHGICPACAKKLYPDLIK